SPISLRPRSRSGRRSSKPRARRSTELEIPDFYPRSHSGSRSFMTRLRSIDLPLEQRTLGALLARRARELGDRPYLSFDGRSYSYAEVDRLTNRLANGLRDKGVRHGEH